MPGAFTSIGEFWNSATEIWGNGGWAMYAIALIAMVMFSVGMNILVKLSATGAREVDEATCRRWIDKPKEREGPIGDILNVVDEARTLKDAASIFRQVRQAEIAPFERDLKVMKVCVSAAPLVGLLGTVTGMLTTFAALSSGTGGDQTMAMIAAGISEALITTETGLVIALPGLFFQYQLRRKFENYRAYIAHMETMYTQWLYRRIQRAQRTDVKKLAHNKIAEALYRAVAS